VAHHKSGLDGCIHSGPWAHLWSAYHPWKLKSRNCPKYGLLSVFPLCWGQTGLQSGFVAQDKSELNGCIHSSSSAHTQLACCTRKLKSGTKHPKIQPSQSVRLHWEQTRLDSAFVAHHKSGLDGCIHSRSSAHLRSACHPWKLKFRNCPKYGLLHVFPLCWG
jgi:uncharacterized protein Usg